MNAQNNVSSAERDAKILAEQRSNEPHQYDDLDGLAEFASATKLDID